MPRRWDREFDSAFLQRGVRNEPRSRNQPLPARGLGDLFRYDSKSDSWKRWHLPSDKPQPYAVYVDDTDAVWVSDWGANAILRFDPKTERGSNPFLYPTATPACGSLLVAKARFGGPNPRPTNSS